MTLREPETPLVYSFQYAQLGIVEAHGCLVDRLLQCPLKDIHFLRVAALVRHGGVGHDPGHLRLGQFAGQHNERFRGPCCHGRPTCAPPVLLHLQGIHSCPWYWNLH